MTRSRVLGLAAFALVCASVVYAAGFGLKPGLWELRVVKQVVDGRDSTAATLGANAKIQQMLANLPPDQRARMEAMLKQRGVGAAADGSFTLCITPEMAQRDRPPIIDREGRCQPAAVTHTGSTTNFTYRCTVNGEALEGSGAATASGDLIAVSSDVTVSGANGPPRRLHNETELRFRGSSCGDVKPVGVPPSAP